MEIQKDIHKTDVMSRFLNNQIIKTNPFGTNRIGERAYKRAERLAAAIVLLTKHVPQSDPLRVSARKLSINLISDVLSSRDEMRSVGSDKISTLKVGIRNLMSIMKLLAVSGHISLQNSEVISEALDGLVEFIAASQKSPLSESVSISREDLADTREGSFKDERESNRLIKDRSQLLENSVVLSAADSKSTSSDTSSRALSILEILRSGQEYGIREVALHLPEYSEKMIQRELAELVRLGKVKKVGLKRWSRYAVVQ